MNRRRRLATIALLVSVVAFGCHNWRGPGFRAGGPEMPRLRHELTLAPGMSVADVGAGRGEMTVALAAEIGPSGRVYATDIDPEALEHIRTRVAAAELRNVTILEARARDTGLPTSCCDAVVLRRVYHHLTDPTAMNRDLLRALRPGGVLAIIDFPPMFAWLWPGRTGHGVAAGLVIEEVKPDVHARRASSRRRRAASTYPDSQIHAERTAAESGATMARGSRASW